jgi:hypothetical protein
MKYQEDDDANYFSIPVYCIIFDCHIEMMMLIVEKKRG